MTEDIKCPKCAKPMESGVVWDHGGLTQIVRPQWFPVDLTATGWLEKLAEALNGKESLVRMKEGLAVITLRCPTCGFLESYAPPQKNP